MRSIVSDGMALDDPMDAEPETGRRTPEFVPEEEDSASSQQNGLARQPSRLQRRVNVIMRAANRGEELPSPSQEMRERAAAEEDEESVNGAGPSRANKRKAALDFEASLTPMEEEEEDEPEPEPEPTPRGRGAPKRGRGARKAGAAATSTPAKRGRGRTAAVAAPPAVISNGEEGETAGRRRSNRLNQSSPVKTTKVARRA